MIEGQLNWSNVENRRVARRVTQRELKAGEAPPPRAPAVERTCECGRTFKTSVGNRLCPRCVVAMRARIAADDPYREELEAVQRRDRDAEVARQEAREDPDAHPHADPHADPREEGDGGGDE